jgi:Fe2+ or Zn2+ uptake regulation protein
MRTAEQQMRDRGVHVTAQRLAIAEAVSAHPHATTDELVEAVRSRIGSISRQAVYDTLSVFVDTKIELAITITTLSVVTAL